MKTIRVVPFAAILLVLRLNAATKPFEGVWEASLEGVKAISLTVRTNNSEPEGTIIFYLIRKLTTNPAQKIAGQTERPLLHPQWDGTTLRFAIVHRSGEPLMYFEFRPGKSGTAQLKKIAWQDEPEQDLSLTRR